MSEWQTDRKDDSSITDNLEERTHSSMRGKGVERLENVLVPFAAPLQRHVGASVIERGQKRFLLVVQTRAGFTVVHQDVAHELHLPLLMVQTGSAVSGPRTRRAAGTATSGESQTASKSGGESASA